MKNVHESHPDNVHAKWDSWSLTPPKKRRSVVNYLSIIAASTAPVVMAAILFN